MIDIIQQYTPVKELQENISVASLGEDVLVKKQQVLKSCLVVVIS